MMRELGGVFGIAVVVAVFAGAGSYASAAAFVDGFAPAIGVGAVLALAGAVAGLALPGRRRSERRRRPSGLPALEQGGHAMRQVMVRYKVKPDRVAENEALVRAVYEELGRDAPDGTPVRDVPARRRRELRAPRHRRHRGRADAAAELRRLPALPGAHPRPLRRAAGGHRALRRSGRIGL